MQDDEDARRRRAAEIRRQIAGLRSNPTPVEEDSDMKPGESPKEYLERREREIRERGGST